MKTIINGAEVEGTPEELALFMKFFTGTESPKSFQATNLNPKEELKEAPPTDPPKKGVMGYFGVGRKHKKHKERPVDSRRIPNYQDKYEGYKSP